MGNRACITIKQETGQPFHLYTHWGADSIAETLAQALRKAKESGRLNDSPYCTRIIFDEMTGLTGATDGFGIIAGDYPGDLAYEPIVVQWRVDSRQPLVYLQGGTLCLDATAFMQAIEYRNGVTA